jgi:hypothetical protein
MNNASQSVVFRFFGIDYIGGMIMKSFENEEKNPFGDMILYRYPGTHDKSMLLRIRNNQKVFKFLNENFDVYENNERYKSLIKVHREYS